MPFDSTPVARVTETVTAKKILQDALTLIEEKGWCQGTGTRDADGNPASRDSPRVAAFCCSAAIYKAGNGMTNQQGDASILFIHANKLRDCGISWWNDQPNRQKAQVIAAFKRAIELA